MPSAAFWRQQRPRRYDYLIEELVAAGSVVTVADATAQLDRRKHWLLRSWTSPTGLRLVAARAGCCRRWRLCCPSCERRCEAVYKVPGDDAAEWACRLCCGGGLQYAARRHGRRHPARRVLTPRQAIITRRRDEQERRLLDGLANSDPWWAQRRDAVLYTMTRVIAQRDSEAARAAAWLRKQPRRPRPTAPPREIARRPDPDVLDVLRLLNAATQSERYD
jgi:hypothetical protein